MLFKLPQHRHQLHQLLRALGWRQQEQDGVEIALLRHNAVLAQVVGENGRRNAEIGIVPCFSINARRGQQQLARIDEILFTGIAFKTVPFCTRFKTKEATLAGDSLRGVILPWPPRHHRWDKRFDHIAVGDDGLARFNAQLDALRPQPASALALVDLGVHVQRRKQRVKRAGGGMQHERIVQPLVRAEARLTANMVILFMDLRRL